ncbi:peroxiredoxin [Brevibacillus dissolubilis]|uniref:peroxiredoxin n=1 Tax=Brevibacillus dissolubilis TaxID=1844116 RepID=UPI0011178DC9|nr:redoxin domain-containing protein [Brevibacillus dissolubilis]
MLSINDPAPLFTAESTQGTIDLRDYRGKKNVVLIFYPADETPTCTKQLCAAQDAFADYDKYDTVVFAVNPADLDTHHKFADRFGYEFPLITDAGGRIRQAYGVGKILGLFAQQRIVYVIDKAGKIIFAQKGNPPTEVLVDVVKNAR